MTVSHAARSSSTPPSAAERRRVPSKRNGVVTIPDRQRAELARDSSDDRSGAGAGAASLSRSDEDHVRPAQRRLQLIERLLGGSTPDGRIGAGPETVREPLSDRDLRRGIRDRERLAVGVDGDEVDLGDPRVHHPVDRVQPGSAHPDHADRGDVGRAPGWRHAVQLRSGLEHRLEVARGGPRSGGLGRDVLLGLHRRRGRSTRRNRLGHLGLWLGRLREVRDVLDGLVERGLRPRVDRRLRHGLCGGLLRALRSLCLPEELGERALTHRRALARHRTPPSRGRGRPVQPARSGRI